MIKFTDATVLALAKLRAHKIRTGITVLLAGLLFGVLIAASLITIGTFRSVESFREDGLTSRYIVSVYPNLRSDVLYQLRRDPRLINEAKTMYEQLIEQKKAEALKLGLVYTQASDQPPYIQSLDGKGDQLALRDKNNIVFKLFQEYFKDKPVVDDIKLKNTAAQYNAIDIFHSTSRQIRQGSTLTVVSGDGEKFYDQTDENEVNTHYARPAIDDSSMTLAPLKITAPFMLPDNAGWKSDGVNIPIILPQNVIEQLLKKEDISSKTNISDKLAYMSQLRADAAHLTVSTCYRNESSVALIQQVIRQQKDIQANQGNANYIKPTVIYGLPDPTRCENPYIISDTRNSSQKQKDQNQDIFDKKFNGKTDPKSYFVNFKVVGISPSQAGGASSGASAEQLGSFGDVVNNLLQTTGIGQVVPRALYDLMDNTAQERYADIFTFSPTYLIGNEDDAQRYVEFANSKDAQRFIDEQGCITEVDGICKPADRDYQLRLSFSNSTALDDIEAKVQEWFRYGMGVIVLLAIIIMWITIARVVADGRYETAVFRAIGFKRGDVAAVYILYTMVLSLLVVIFAAGIGYLCAYLINLHFGPLFTAQALSSFGGTDMTKHVDLIGFSQQQLLILTTCFMTGLIGMVVPLISSMYRAPIRAIREG